MEIIIPFFVSYDFISSKFFVHCNISIPESVSVKNSPFQAPEEGLLLFRQLLHEIVKLAPQHNPHCAYFHQ